MHKAFQSMASLEFKFHVAVNINGRILEFKFQLNAFYYVLLTLIVK